MQPCANCGIWPLKDSDCYCSFCGKVCFQVKIDDPVPSSVPENEKIAQLQFAIENTGCAAAYLELTECRPSYLAIYNLPPSMDIQPGESKAVIVTADFSGGGVVLARLKWLLSSRLKKSRAKKYEIIGSFLSEPMIEKEMK